VFYRECLACVLQGVLSLCSAGSAQLVFYGSPQIVFYRYRSAYVLKGMLSLCSAESANLVSSDCVPQGMLSLCSAGSAQLVYIVELSVSNPQMLAREELIRLENLVRLFERSAVHFPIAQRVAQQKATLRFPSYESKYVKYVLLCYHQKYVNTCIVHTT
jgi:hypothetical protein